LPISPRPRRRRPPSARGRDTTQLHALLSDITGETTDAIVNAANTELATGGGVCGAIHRAAGPELARACRALGSCPTGQARITPGFNLVAKYVIHAVGPVWQGGTAGEAELLASCYRSALDLAAEWGLASIAFPSISTGIYGYPVAEAAAVAVRAVREHAPLTPGIALVRFACFNERDLAVYQGLMK
jgi:O-acetyl-ADP-ribose deacetylase (regulator of RNase III)